jgi:hypothetical protein
LVEVCFRRFLVQHSRRERVMVMWFLVLVLVLALVLVLMLVVLVPVLVPVLWWRL